MKRQGSPQRGMVPEWPRVRWEPLQAEGRSTPSSLAGSELGFEAAVLRPGSSGGTGVVGGLVRAQGQG